MGRRARAWGAGLYRELGSRAAEEGLGLQCSSSRMWWFVFNVYMLPIWPTVFQLGFSPGFCQSLGGRPLATSSFLKLQKSKLYNGLFNPEKLSSKCFIWLLPYLHQPLLHLCDLIHILWHHTPTKLLIWSTLYYLQCSLLYFSINGTPAQIIAHNYSELEFRVFMVFLNKNVKTSRPPPHRLWKFFFP